MPRDDMPKPKTLKGKIPYSSKSRNLGFYEILAPGCFGESLRAGGFEGDVLARYEHDSRMLLGRRSAGTLRLQDSPGALNYECDLPATSCGADVAHLAERGDLKNSSFCFIVEDYERDEKWDVTPDGQLIRTILRAELMEVSPVADPAYPEATVSVA